MESRRLSIDRIIHIGMLIVLVWIAFVLWDAGASREELDDLKKDAVQAVFLSNGQVYFGHITDADESTLTLEDIYYLEQVDQQLQAGEEAAAAGEGTANLSLTKLGEGQLHDPEDLMVIQRENILFWENLKPDSGVVKAMSK